MPVLKYNNRNTYFNGVGTKVESNDLNEIIKLSGLDYEVQKVQNYDVEGEKIDSYSTRYFDEEGKKHYLCSTLKKQYEVLQNYEAFGFMQDLMGDIQIECAGVINGGRQAFILAKTESTKILDDPINPYLLIVNSFDGSTGVKVMLTPIRVWCSNCLAIALKNAQQSISIKHYKDVQGKLYASSNVLLQNTKYLEAIKDQMERLATMRFTRKKYVDILVPSILKKMNLLNADGTEKEKKRNLELVDRYRDHLLACWTMGDLDNYKLTKYSALQAVLDFESHMQFARNGDNPETRFKLYINGSMQLGTYALNLLNNL